MQSTVATKKNNKVSKWYRLMVTYRFVLTFATGYFCACYLSLLLTTMFLHFLAKAEAIYLACFVSILFYVFFVIFSFCLNAVRRLTIFSIISCIVIFTLAQVIG